LERNQHGPPRIFMKNKLSFEKCFIVFLLASLILFIESFLHYYSALIGYVFNYLGPFNYYGSKVGYNIYIWGENGVVENFQILFLAFSIYLFFNFISNSSYTVKQNIFCYLYLLGIVYFFLEEISYGQHLFKWESSEFFILKNNQKETNLHNISNLFDQLPRALLSCWLVMPIIISRYFLKYNNFITNFILPFSQLKAISIFFLVIFLPNLIAQKFSLYPAYVTHSQSIQSTDIFDFFTFNYIKLSEYIELIFCFYIFSHSMFLTKNFKSEA